MHFIGFCFTGQLIKSVNPLPNRFWVLIIKCFRYKVFRLDFFSFKYKFFWVHSIFASESRHTAINWNSCSSNEKNLCILHHWLHGCTHWNFRRSFPAIIWASQSICNLSLLERTCTHRITDFYSESFHYLAILFLHFVDYIDRSVPFLIFLGTTWCFSWITHVLPYSWVKIIKKWGYLI